MGQVTGGSELRELKFCFKSAKTCIFFVPNLAPVASVALVVRLGAHQIDVPAIAAQAVAPLALSEESGGELIKNSYNNNSYYIKDIHPRNKLTGGGVRPICRVIADIHEILLRVTPHPHPQPQP